jgi:hypothetical protein
MSTKFFTNDNENTLINKFKGVLTSGNNFKNLDALVSYLRSSEYFKFKEFLNEIPEVRISFGINADKITYLINNINNEQTTISSQNLGISKPNAFQN